MSLKVIEIPPKKEAKSLLMGAGHTLCKFLEMLVERGFPKPVIITHPKEKHERDIKLNHNKDVYGNVFEVAKELGIKLIESEKLDLASIVNDEDALKASIAFSFSCRSIINKDVINHFNNRIFNIHPSYLPEERGGGVFSWRILREQNFVAGTIHIIDEGIDTGDIVLQKKELQKTATPKPEDMLAATNKLFIELLNEFLEEAEHKRKFFVIPQLNSSSS